MYDTKCRIWQAYIRHFISQPKQSSPAHVVDCATCRSYNLDPGAGGRTRTDTPLGNRFLKPARLPVPLLPHIAPAGNPNQGFIPWTRLTFESGHVYCNVLILHSISIVIACMCKRMCKFRLFRTAFRGPLAGRWCVHRSGGRRKVFQDFCCVRCSVALAVSSGLGADSASRARRNTRSLAVFVRSTRARCSYSGIELGPPDNRFCLKRRSASSLEVMTISLALN